jgi:hypothetical protein
MAAQYFVCDRLRCTLDLKYIEEFYKKNKDTINFHDNGEDAREEMHRGFYDDSDYEVIKVENGIFTYHNTMRTLE